MPAKGLGIARSPYKGLNERVPNRQLTAHELESVGHLLDRIRSDIDTLSAGDPELLFAIRRKIFKELGYDERGKPMQRRMLKLKKMAEQKGACAVCGGTLPEKYSVLDRVEAIKGYTPENTRVLCPACDTELQQQRGYA